MTTLLISAGGGGYPNAPALRHPSFVQSSRAVASFLTTGGEPMLRPANHLNLFDDHRAWSEQLMALRRWLRVMIPETGQQKENNRVENVLVHYVGHGMFKPNSEEHYLSINATDAEDRSVTSASLGQLNDILLKNAPWQRRIYLIDACFAAASIRNLMGAPDDAIEISVGGILGAWPEGDWGHSGVAALCSADRTATASAGGQRELTQFTDGLLNVLETGDEESSASLSLRRIHQLLRRALATRYGAEAVHPILVAPEDGDGGIAAAPLFPNLAKRGPEGERGPISLERRVDARAGESDNGIAGSALGEGVSGEAVRASGAAYSNSRLAMERGMMPEVGGGEPADWGLEVGRSSTLDMEETLSPEQRFRQAAYRFFRLPHSKKDEIARKLDPAGSTNEGLPDLERYKGVLAEARRTGAVDRLESMILRAEGQ